MSDPIDDTLRRLATPVGQTGSGRQRYAAAMTLHRSGHLNDSALEVYRICAGRDSDDPRALLVTRNLAGQVPIAPAASPKSAIVTLVDEVDRYLATLPGPGVAEVRQGIASAQGGPIIPQSSALNAVTSQYLVAALDPLAKTHAALADAIAATVPHLNWRTFDGYPPAEIGADFPAGNAYCIVIGEDGPIKAQGFDLGLFLMAPHVLYRDHRHKASELYAPLTGPHGWRFGVDRPLIIKPAHQPVWNEPDVPHLTKVGPVPFLCIYGWTRDVNEPAHVIPATDWPALEALRLEG